MSAAQQSDPASSSAAAAAQPAPQNAAPQSDSSQKDSSQKDSSSKPAAPGQDAAPAAVPQAADKEKDKAAQATSGQKKPAKGTSNDRLFLALPNFLTLEGGAKVPPLTTGQKFKVVARGAFDEVQFPWYLSLAAISQAENSEPGYGQGWEGYGKRFASAFADGATENILVGAVFPSLLHQDPRFYQSSTGGPWRRAGYAASRIFVTRTDSGHSQFNYSEILGSALSATISTNTYHPRAFITHRYDPTTNMIISVHNPSDRTLPNTISVWGSQMGYDTLTYMIKEFWPDLRRKVKKHNNSVEGQPAVANPQPQTQP